MVWGKGGVKVLAVCIITILLFSSFQVGLDDFLNHTISKDLAKQNNTQKAYALSSLAGTNLVSQIELLDYYFPILSTSFVEVPGTQFNLNPSLYDGQVTFFFEVVMQSSSSANTVTAKLFDKTSNTVVSNSVLSTSSTSPVRLKSPALTLPSSADEYAIQVSTSSNSGLLLSGRIIVSQNGATNTSVVIPIGNVAVSLSGQPDGNNPMSTSNTSPTLIRQIAKIYHYNQTKFDGKLNLFFESVISTNKLSRTTSAFLFDLTTNSTVTGSQVTTSNFIPTKVRSGNLTLASGHDYTFAISSSATDAIATSFASRIILTQNNFTATEIPIRVANIFASTNANIVNASTSISSINASAFTSPRFSFEADLFTTNSSLPVSVNLFDIRKNSIISGSTVTASNLVSTRVRAENVNLSQTADEYITQLKGSGNIVTVNNGWVLVSMNLSNRYTDIMTELGKISSIADESVVTDYLNKTIISLKANTTSLVSNSNARSTLLSILDNALQNVQSAGNSVSALDKANANMSINNARTSITNYINQVSSFSGTSIPTTTANILVSEAQQTLTDTHKQGTAIVDLVKNNPLTVTGSIINKAKTDGTSLRQITNSLISLGFKVTLNAVHHSPTVTDILFSNAATLQSFDFIIPANTLSMYAVLGISDETASVGNPLSTAEFASTMNVTPLMVNNLLNSPDASADVKLAVAIACHPIFTTQECQFGFANPNSPLARFAIGPAGGAAPGAGIVITVCFELNICGPLLEQLTDALSHILARSLEQAKPTVTVVKVVNGGTLSASAFMIRVIANPPTSPSNFTAELAPGTVVRVLPGDYNVTEDVVSGYTQNKNSTCTGTISSLGQHKTCLVTNTFVPSTPAINKHKLTGYFLFNQTSYAVGADNNFCSQAGGDVCALNGAFGFQNGVGHPLGIIDYADDFTATNTRSSSWACYVFGCGSIWDMLHNGGTTTINFWFKSDSFTHTGDVTRYFLSTNGGQSIGTEVFANYTGGIVYDIGNGSIDIILLAVNHVLPNDTNWHMITFTWDKNFSCDLSVGKANAKFYLDGVLNVPSETCQVGTPSNSGAQGILLLGAFPNPPNFQFPLLGSMDELSIWNRTITASDVKSLYNGGNALSLLPR